MFLITSYKSYYAYIIFSEGYMMKMGMVFITPHFYIRLLHSFSVEKNFKCKTTTVKLFLDITILWYCDGNLWQMHKQLIFWIEQLSLIIQKSRKPDIICLLFTNKQHLLHISYNLCCCKNKFYEDGRIPTEFCTKYTSCAHKFDACRNME